MLAISFALLAKHCHSRSRNGHTASSIDRPAGIVEELRTSLWGMLCLSGDLSTMFEDTVNVSISNGMV